MAVLLNQVSNLRFRLDLVTRKSDGTIEPASLEASFAVERYKHIAAGERGEHRFVPLIALAGRTLLDMDVITFLTALEAALGGPGGAAALEASAEPSLALRVAGGPEAYLVEVGIDLLGLLEPVAGDRGSAGGDLALFRFTANARAVAAFCTALIEEFGRFPTDPSKVRPGDAA